MISTIRKFEAYLQTLELKALLSAGDSGPARAGALAEPAAEWAERRQFFRAWLANPMGIGAVLPSSAALGNAMTAEIGDASGAVIELGPGTGRFTRAMIARGVAEENISLVEADPNFADLLRVQHPSARVLCMDAARLRDLELVHGKVGAVLSGLPLLSMSYATIVDIVEGAFRHLRRDGAFYQFTYGFRCPVPAPLLGRLGLQANRIRRVFANFPPASVYRISRAGAGFGRREAARYEPTGGDAVSTG